MEAAGDVDRSVGTENDARRVDQIEVRAGDRRFDLPVDPRWRAAGNAADDVGDGRVHRGTGKIRRLAVAQPKQAETLEQVAADLLPQIGADRIDARDGVKRLRRG